jgi:Cellulase (glycosyl hydrolase family 5)
LSGAEFGAGSKYGYNYLYPSSADLDRYKAAGMELIRLPFKWERMQPTLNGPLSSAELGRLTAFLDAAEARGMKVVLDLHNDGRFGGAVIGSPQVPVSAFEHPRHDGVAGAPGRQVRMACD